MNSKQKNKYILAHWKTVKKLIAKDGDQQELEELFKPVEDTFASDKKAKNQIHGPYYCTQLKDVIKKLEEKQFDLEVILKLKYTLIDLYLLFRVYSAVLHELRAVNDLDRLKVEADKLLAKQEDLCLAFEVYEKLNDFQSMRKIKMIWQSQGNKVELVTSMYLMLKQKILDQFQLFYQSLGFSSVMAFDTEQIFNSAVQLSSYYDVVIPIAGGGLYSGFIFSLFNLPVVTLNCYHRGRGVYAKWLADPSIIEGKRVLILEKDCYKGRTLQRAMREILWREPACVDIHFLHGPIIEHTASQFHLGTVVQNVPLSIGNIFYPEMFGCQGYLKAEEYLMNKLGVKYE